MHISQDESPEVRSDNGISRKPFMNVLTVDRKEPTSKDKQKRLALIDESFSGVALVLRVGCRGK